MSNFTGSSNFQVAGWDKEHFNREILLSNKAGSVFAQIAGSTYFNELKSSGTTVKIQKAPVITANAYTRGTTLVTQDIEMGLLELQLTDGAYTQIKIDYTEEQFADKDYMGRLAMQAAESLSRQLETTSFAQVEADMAVSFLANKVVSDPLHGQFIREGDATQTINIAADTTTSAIITELKIDSLEVINADVTVGTGQARALDIVRDMDSYLSKKHVPRNGRWLACGSDFINALLSSNSPLISTDFVEKGALSTGEIMFKIHGFTVYRSDLMADDLILAGGIDTLAGGVAMTKTEKLTDPDAFGDIIRSLMISGSGVIRDDSLVGAYVTYA